LWQYLTKSDIISTEILHSGVQVNVGKLPVWKTPSLKNQYQGEMMKRRTAMLLMIALLLALSACASAPASPTATQTSAPVLTTPSEMPSPSATPPTDEDRYRIEEARLSIKLPQGWSVSGPLEVSSEGMPTFEIYFLGIDPSANGGPGFSKIAIADPAQWTPEQFVLSQCSTCTEQPFEDVTLGGKSAKRTQIGGGGVPILVTWYFVENNGKLIALAIHDPETLEPLEEVLQSIQFE
jgi:hypothetical protein